LSHLILVLGCHRSGTSPITRSLRCLGVELGAMAEWTGDDNVHGFWEHIGVLGTDEAILARIGRTWDDPEPWGTLLENFLRYGAKAPRLADQARAGLAADLAAHPLFGIKDPRLCRLLPFWRPVLTSLGCQVSVVLVVRHPSEVAASLMRRNSMPLEQALALWLKHTRRARLDADPKWATVTVDAGMMMGAPVWSIKRMGEALGLSVDPAARREFVEDFLDRGRWHRAAPEIELPTDVAFEWEMAKTRATT
jgi:hypothetical protein